MTIVIEALIAFLLVQVNFILTWDRPRAAQPGQFPHQASIFWGTPPEVAFAHSCGGVIINEFWILSSGYCVDHVLLTNSSRIKVGVHDINVMDEHVQTLAIRTGIIHEKYRGADIIANFIDYDLGLIKTIEQITFNDRVRPIELPKKTGFLKGKYKLQYNLILSGWGSIAFGIIEDHPTVLFTVNVPVVPNKVCQQSIRTIMENFVLGDTQMCTRPIDGSLAACIGDFGGPLIQYNSENKPVIIGIMGWGIIPCNTNGLPPIFSRIPHFYKWIKKKIRHN